MRSLRLISRYFSKTLFKDSIFKPLSSTNGFSTLSKEHIAPNPSHEVAQIVEELSGLTLVEISDLTDLLRNKMAMKEMPMMMVMMPGMGFGGVRVMEKAKSAAAAGKAEEKAEKTAFDLKLESFDASAKIKVIKEVRSCTELGLKEAKDLVERVPTLLKKSVDKGEAENIIQKMKEIGAIVVME